MSEYERSSFHLKLVDGSDTITLSKLPHSDWSDIRLEVNGREVAVITLRSEHAAAMLHAMLGRMLKAGER